MEFAKRITSRLSHETLRGGYSNSGTVTGMSSVYREVIDQYFPGMDYRKRKDNVKNDRRAYYGGSRLEQSALAQTRRKRRRIHWHSVR